MLKTLRAKFAALFLAILAVTGLGLVTAAPAEALTVSGATGCFSGLPTGRVNWNNTGNIVRVTAYTQTGSRIGWRDFSGAGSYRVNASGLIKFTFYGVNANFGYAVTCTW